MGRRHHLCPRGRVLRQHLLLPKLPDPHLLPGEVPARGRLPLRQQDELRAARAQHPPVHAPDAAHPARPGLQVVSRSPAVALQARGRIRHPAAGRHRSLQLPRRGHRGTRLPADGHLFLGLRSGTPDQRRPRPDKPRQPLPRRAAHLLLPALHFGHELHTQQPADLRRSRIPPRRPPGELRETLHSPAGRRTGNKGRRSLHQRHTPEDARRGAIHLLRLDRRPPERGNPAGPASPTAKTAAMSIRST